MITLAWWQLCIIIALWFFAGMWFEVILIKKWLEYKAGIIKKRRRKVNTRKYWQ